MHEEWRDTVEYPGVYQVSSLGRVRRLWHGSSKPIRPATIRGYLVVHLSWKNVDKMHPVHRLVARAFIGEIGELTVNHKNSIRSDNRLENLEIMSMQDNITHSLTIGGRVIKGADNPNAKLNETDVLVIRCLLHDGMSSAAIARAYGVNTPCISKIKKRRTWTHL